MEESIDNILKIYPKTLDINNPDVIEVSNYYLPYSTGFEIECYKHDSYDEVNFTSIPNIIEVINDNSEQRYRIPSGINGLNCLYDIAYQLKFNSVLTDSGIHYHVDCSDFWDKLNLQVLEEEAENILQELDTWNYKGTYNKRGFSIYDFPNPKYGNSNIPNGMWVRFQKPFKTMEFRIGEMTFDYALLFKRITHINSIVREFKRKSIIKWNMENNPLLMYEDNIDKVLKNRITKI